MEQEPEATRFEAVAGNDVAAEVRLRPSAGHALVHDDHLRQRLLRIRITDIETGRLVVSLRLPGGLLAVAERLGARLAPPGIGMAALASALQQSEAHEPLVVEDARNGERIEITVEG